MGAEVTTSQEYVYFGRIINLRVDNVRLRDGGVARREIVEHRDAVTIVPLDKRRQRAASCASSARPWSRNVRAARRRHGRRRKPGSRRRRRELAEETGLTADSLQHLAGFYTSTRLHATSTPPLRRPPTCARWTATPDEDEDISLRLDTARRRAGHDRDRRGARRQDHHRPAHGSRLEC